MIVICCHEIVLTTESVGKFKQPKNMKWYVQIQFNLGDKQHHKQKQLSVCTFILAVYLKAAALVNELREYFSAPSQFIKNYKPRCL